MLRQSNKEPLTVYGIAVGFVHPPDSAFGTWLAVKEHGDWGDTLRIVDSSGPTYNATRYYHVEAFIHADSIDASTPDCNSQVTGSMDTAVLCYEYYFTQPITVDSAFYIGVYPRMINGEYQDHSFIYMTDLCSDAALQGNWSWTPATIPDPNSWEGGRYHARTHWIYRNTGSAVRGIIMPIIRPSTECDVPFCGSVDSLWMETDGAGQVSLEWTALSCVTTRYEVNYGSDKPFMDTTVITTSTTLPLPELLPGSLAY
ncbi:MAG: hypothetical protein II532_01120, partial [Bacteroidales bacterium]|nr:hypothetical protein [Bacteroidales bacterium]